MTCLTFQLMSVRIKLQKQIETTEPDDFDRWFADLLEVPWDEYLAYDDKLERRNLLEHQLQHQCLWRMIMIKNKNQKVTISHS